MANGDDIGCLYSSPLPSRRVGALYNAFSYPTKIDAETVALFLATHTEPGQTVLDPFGGSGSTGVAARLCDQPTSRMLQMAVDVGVRPTWGPRSAVVYEISPIGALAAQVMTDPPEPAAFQCAATKMLDAVGVELGWMYSASGPDNSLGHIRYVVWSEVLQTPCCRVTTTFWDAAVERDPLVLRKSFECRNCGMPALISDCQRVTESRLDPLTGGPIRQRKRRPVMVYGESGGHTWSRPPTRDDLHQIKLIEASPFPSGIPLAPINWGDLHRSGYHFGLTHFHHLYTARNLRVMAALWFQANRHSGRLRDALRLLVLSYNATHSTLLTRVVAKKNQKDFVVTGAQSGVLYVSGLPVEKNIIEGIRRKTKTFVDAFDITRGSQSDVTVVNGSSTSIDLPANSIDYVFTDPPFGDFIPYAEVNQINEVWLGRLTDRTDEAIISAAQGKGPDEYSALMCAVFAEIARVLRPDGKATVVFHASKPVVWTAIGEAFRSNGLAVEKTSVLDKTQVSFKQAVHEGGTRGDAVFLLGHSGRTEITSTNDVSDTVRDLERTARGKDDELLPRRMYSRYVAHCVQTQSTVAMTAPSFYAYLADTRADQERGTA